MTSQAFAAEDEVVVALEPGYGNLSSEVEGLHGGGGHLTLAFGLTDELWLTGSFGGFRQAAGEIRPGLTLYDAFGGLTVALDVLRTIPFVEVLIGAVVANLEDRTKLDPTLRIGAGADFLFTPSISLGGVVRWRPVSDDIGGSYITAALRFSWRIEL